MKKRMNKKGFSLVELMIVVVIMGILVAVAIPLYGAITGNAEKKTCRNNQHAIRGAFANYVVSDNAKSADTLFITTEKKFDGSGTKTQEEVFDPAFLNRFDGGKLPECPVDGHYYVIEKVSDTEIKIGCYVNGELDGKHTENS